MEIAEIQKLRSLIRGCDFRTCGLSDPDCRDKACNDDGCKGCDSLLDGPGKNKCYWSQFLDGACDAYWSISTDPNDTEGAWKVDFMMHIFEIDGKMFTALVRCVRTGI